MTIMVRVRLAPVAVGIGHRRPQEVIHLVRAAVTVWGRAIWVITRQVFMLVRAVTVIRVGYTLSAVGKLPQDLPHRSTRKRP
jgi:hypothetical protein